jgi:hypothetical protein
VWILKGSDPVPVDVKTGPTNGTLTVVTDGNVSAGALAVIDVITR